MTMPTAANSAGGKHLPYEAKHIDDVGRPLCPCNFYEDKAAEAKSSEWVCACEEMQKYKYCH